MAGVVFPEEDSESSSGNDSSQSEEDEDDYEMFVGVMGYQFEPVRRARDGDTSEGSPNQDGTDSGRRLGNSDWCTCSCCVPMATVTESCCCLEQTKIIYRMEQYAEMHGEKLSCITQHPGFKANCLDCWVLEVAYLQYKQQYQVQRMDFEQNVIYRHTAYRQLVRWCWGVVGRHNRIPLPACCISKIREAFPAGDQCHTGFKWPKFL